MKSSNQEKVNILSGVLLLIVAATFSISLLIQAFDFGIYESSKLSFLYIIGKMLFSVYGFSSILIPVFFFIAGISCFMSSWTARKAFRLLTAIVPFFTSVICENICRAALADANAEFVAVKITVVLITGIMLVIIEFIGAGIIADKINGTQKTGLKKFTVPSSDISKATNSNSVNLVDVKNDDDHTLTDEEIGEDILGDIPTDENDYTSEEFNGDSEYATDDELYDDDLLEEDEEVEEEPETNETDFSNVDFNDEKYDDVQIHPAFKEPFDQEQNNENAQNSETENSNVEISNTENPSNNQNENPDKNISENTAGTKESENYPEQKSNSNEITSEPTTTHANDSSENESLAQSENQPMQPLLSKEEYDALIIGDTPEESNDEIEWNNLPPVQDKLPPDYDPNYETTNDEPPEEKEPIDESNIPPVEYDEPTPEDESPMPEIDIVPLELPDADNEDDYDNTDNSDTVDTSMFDVSFADETAEENTPEEIDETIDDDYSGDDIPEDYVSDDELKEREELEKELEGDDKKKTDDLNDKEILDDDSVNEIFSGASDVFEEMEDDIRKENGLPEEPENSVMYEGQVIHVQSHGNPNSNSATNLTPDGMEDFFNAQQKENTPVTQTIDGNLPPKNSHRAIKKGPYVIPSDLLTEYADDQYWVIDEDTKAASIELRNTLADFNIEAEIIGIKKGPVVTMFEILPAPGVKLSKIVGLQDNIALRLAASSVRIVAPIPGKSAVGIEVPNKHRSIVSFREMIEQDLEEFKKMSIPVVLGKDILGKAQLLDLVKTPHLLIAGATGAGKSVCVNSIILSILYKRSPDKVKLILVDPKVVELKLYNNIPHLLTPVITEPKKAFQALQYCLCEMERRYSMLDNMGVRDISSYNSRIKERKLVQEQLPYIVVIIDEFADLMATTGKELESTVARLAAMSRAVGIHLVLATQRPSVNVITGLIKANIPSRIAFMVASRMDSSIIIDSAGAEKLLGRGDMLYASAVDPNPVRIQGTFVSDEEVEAVVDYVKQYGEPDYIDDEIFVDDEDEQGELFDDDENFGDDPLYDQALEIVIREGKASASFIQRKLKIGYNRAARLVEEMEERGIVGPANGSKPREVIHVP